jgi:hypothetical protein
VQYDDGRFSLAAKPNVPSEGTFCVPATKEGAAAVERMTMEQRTTIYRVDGAFEISLHNPTPPPWPYDHVGDSTTAFLRLVQPVGGVGSTHSTSEVGEPSLSKCRRFDQ